MIISGTDYAKVERHLFRDDFDEHAALLGVGISQTSANLRLLVRNVVLVPDEEFQSRATGWHLNSTFIADTCLRFEKEGLGYVSVHSHPFSDAAVALSGSDLRSHRRSFPVTQQLVRGKPVAGLALGRNSACGEVWEAGKKPASLDLVRVLGPVALDRYPSPQALERSLGISRERHSRQALMLGEAGQHLLSSCLVGVVGLGGGGSILVQELAHLGVGGIVGIDCDVMKELNLNRVVGSTPKDALERRKKGAVLKRLVRSIDPKIRFRFVDGDVTHEHVTKELLDCDFIFLATDSLSSRNVVNQLCYQFMIPGIQIGAKVQTDSESGDVTQIHGNLRWMHPDCGCLACHGAINAAALAKELLSPEERKAQDYLDEEEVPDPSVVTLNGTVASLAATDFLLWRTALFAALTKAFNLNNRVWLPQTRELLDQTQRRERTCRVCGQGSSSVRGLGDRWGLMPTVQGS